jgi:hypothetical protein
MKYPAAFILCFVMISFFAILACGETADEPVTVQDTGPDTLEITVSDTLGLLFGDSAYVFGTITQASLGQDGNLYVMDGQMGRIAIFSPRMDPIGYIGRLGTGPGEFQYPQSFAFLPDGRLVVADWGAVSVVFFDSTMEFSHLLSGFYPSSPRYLVPGPGGDTYVALCMELDEGGSEITGRSFIGRYGAGMEPEHIYDSWPLMITAYGDPDDPDLSIGRVDHDFDTGLDGTVYLAERDDSTYLVEAFPPDGTVDSLVFRPWERIEKTQEQLERQFYEEGRSTGSEGTRISRRTIDDVYPWLNAIASVDVDVDGNIWVGQGYTEIPTFEVYSPSGELLYVAVIPELEGIRGLEYCFRNGYIAYDRQPEDYPKVYFLEPGLPDS